VTPERGGRRTRRPPDLLQVLADSPSEADRVVAARAPETPPAALSRLGFDHDAAVRIAVLTNPACPWGVLAAHLSGPAGPELQHAAAHPGTPRDEVAHLLTSEDPARRAAGAANPHLTAGDCDLLSQDPDPTVRAALAANELAFPASLATFPADPDPRVREALAANPSVPLALLGGLRISDVPPWQARSFIDRSVPDQGARAKALQRLAEASGEMLLAALLL
jgi:hypothetical protein